MELGAEVYGVVVMGRIRTKIQNKVDADYSPNINPSKGIRTRSFSSGSESNSIEQSGEISRSFLNHDLTSYLSNSGIQPKFTVGAVGDKYEQEADTVASKVVEHINSPKGSIDSSSISVI